MSERSYKSHNFKSLTLLGSDQFRRVSVRAKPDQGTFIFFCFVKLGTQNQSSLDQVKQRVKIRDEFASKPAFLALNQSTALLFEEGRHREKKFL